MCRIFDDGRVADNGRQLFDGSGLAEQVHGHDRFNGRAHRLINRIDVDQVGIRVAVDELDLSAGADHPKGAGDEAVGRHDHLIAGPEAETANGHLEGIRTAGHANTIPDVAECGKGLLEFGHLRSMDESGVRHHAFEPRR